MKQNKGYADIYFFFVLEGGLDEPVTFDYDFEVEPGHIFVQIGIKLKYSKIFLFLCVYCH